MLEPSVFCSEPLETGNQSERREPTDDEDRPNKRPRLDTKDSEIPPEPAIPHDVDVDRKPDCVKSEVNEDDLNLTYPGQDETPATVVIDSAIPRAELSNHYIDKLFCLHNDRVICRLCMHLYVGSVVHLIESFLTLSFLSYFQTISRQNDRDCLFPPHHLLGSACLSLRKVTF